MNDALRRRIVRFLLISCSAVLLASGLLGCEPGDEAQARETREAAPSPGETHRAGRAGPPGVVASTTVAAEPVADEDDAVVEDDAPEVAPIALEVVSGIELTVPDDDERKLKVPAATHDVLDAMVDDKGRLVAVLRPGNVFIASQDAGRTWRSWVTETEVVQLVADGRTWYGLSDVDPDGSAHRLSRSQDRGQSWELRLTGRSMQPHHPSMLIGAGGEMVMAVDRHVLVSQNAKKWRWQDPGFPELSPITALTWLPGTSPALVAGAEGGHVAVRDKNGTWRAEPLPPESGSPTGFARTTDGQLLAATTRGLFRRTDDGWQAVEGLEGRALHGVVLSGDHGVAFGSAGELARTIDGGASWTRHTAQVLNELGLGDRAHALDALEINWRQALPTKDGAFVVLGDDLKVVRVGE